MRTERRFPVEEESHRQFFAPRRSDDLSSHALRQAIGYVGLLLPVLLWLVARWRSTDGFPGWRTLDSISAYYHSGSVAIFTGALAALAVFLFTYKGYQNEARRLDEWTGKVACLAALGVSLFPTGAIAPLGAPGWWKEWMRPVHYGSAALLFGCFIFYSLFLFPRTARNESPTPEDKKRRNLVYRGCGIGMAICIAWAGFAGARGAPIFWPETLTLSLFGVSWLTKGRAEWTLRQVARTIGSMGRRRAQ